MSRRRSRVCPITSCVRQALWIFLHNKKHSQAMILESTVFTLINPQNGNLAFKLTTFSDGSSFDHLQRHNYYSLIWVQQGAGKVRADFKEYELLSNNLFAFSPYQPFIFLAEHLNGVALYFHPDFFCIHKHQDEIACNGVLFNNIYREL